LENFSKLKWSPGWYVPILIFSFLFIIAFEISLTDRIGYAVWIFGAFFILLGIYDYYRTRLVTFFFIGLLFGTGTWHSILAFSGIQPFSFITYTVHVIAVVFFFIFLWPVIRNQVRLDRYARRIFHTAANAVHDKAQGYTNRPFSAGKVEYAFEEIEGFARFLSGKQMVRVFNQEETIFLAFSLGISPQSNPDLNQVSYVSFSREGDVSVHISEYDYSRYRDEITFDRLCAALADLFMRFLTYYARGKEMRIETELKE